MNLKTALGDERLFDDAFYAEPNLQEFFGGAEAEKIYVKQGRPMPFTKFYISGFSAMVPPLAPAGSKIALPGLRADIFKVTSDGQEHGKIIRVGGFLSFNSEGDHLGAKYVMSKLGYPWIEDREAEEKAFWAIAREPFNPPARPQHIMRYAWTEHGYKKEVVLNFGAGHYLLDLRFSAAAE